MTTLILSILDSEGKIVIALLASQTPAQQQVLWDRYIAVTAPLQALLIRIENLVPAPADPVAAPAAPAAAVAAAPPAAAPAPVKGA